MKTAVHTTLLVLLLGCDGTLLTERDPADPTAPTDPASFDTGDDFFPPTIWASGVINTFHHPATLGGARPTTAREALARMQAEGPPGYSARVHACRKMRYRTVGNLLASLGVDLDATGETSAGAIYRRSDQALGAANYGARIAETREVTVASSSRLFDIFVQAAPEIIAAMPDLEQCRVGGVGVEAFDASGRCNRDGISCLMGAPSTEFHVVLCDETVRRAATPEQGQALAVATLLSASHTCE